MDVDRLKRGITQRQESCFYTLFARFEGRCRNRCIDKPNPILLSLSAFRGNMPGQSPQAQDCADPMCSQDLEIAFAFRSESFKNSGRHLSKGEFRWRARA